MDYVRHLSRPSALCLDSQDVDFILQKRLAKDQSIPAASAVSAPAAAAAAGSGEGPRGGGVRRN
jgi:ribosomal protein L12E/L44/L45/RPP1/RPP2